MFTHLVVRFILVTILYIGSSDADNIQLWTINITCPDGWMKAMNNCYLFNNQDQLTWQESRMECASQNADLMIISNKEEQNWINIQTEEYKTDEWWVGLQKSAGAWSWVQYGGDNSIINWRNEPDNYDDQDCIAINEFGLFSDEYCRSQLGFICKYSIQTGDYCPSSTDPWFMTDTACYFISPLLNNSLHLTWTQAKTYCSNMGISGKNLQLMSVTSYDEMRSLTSLLSSYDTNGILLPWWTGLNDIQTEGTYVYQDGSLANGSLIQWDSAPNKNNVGITRRCGVMYQGGTIDDTSCDKRAHYVCEMSAIQATQQPQNNSGYLNLGCGSWLRAGQSCYLLGTSQAYSWSQAKDMCSRAGAHLLRIDSLDEKEWVANLNFNMMYWTGLNRFQGSWAWDDQTTAQTDYINWSHEPNSYGGDERCAVINRNGLYNSLECTSKIGYICEYPVSYDVACLPGFSKCESSCYYYSTNDSINWYEAKEKCNDMVSQNQELTGFRLSVNDVPEQACINASLLNQPKGTPGYWTDLNDLAVKGIWQYQDAFNNPPNMDLVPWAGEPNNDNGNEDCGVLYKDGLFRDSNCETKVSFICEKRSATVSSTSRNSFGTPVILIMLIFDLINYF